MASRFKSRASGVSLIAICVASFATAQDQGVTYTFFGTPGLLEMPTAVAPAEGEVAATIGIFGPYQRNSFTYQVTDRLSATFRYGSTDDYSLPGFNPPRNGNVYFDRSFDLRYKITDQDGWRPSVSVGLQDFLGTGQYGGEYVVATRTIGDAFRVTAGLGWGRLASAGGFDNPLGVISSSFEDRPGLDFGLGGEVEANQFFRGDAALFGGVEWSVADDWVLKAEYSSDANAREEQLGSIDVASPLNFGATWTPRPGVQLSAAYLYGSEIGLSGTIAFNPNNRPVDGGFDSPPVPVMVRQGDAAAALSWDRAADPQDDLRAQLRRGLSREGISLEAFEFSDRAARVRYSNNRYSTEAQAMGRVARVMTDVLPPSMETFTLEPMSRGIPISAATIQRRDLEQFELQAGGTQAMQDRIALNDAGSNQGLTVVPDEDPFFWGISPFFGVTLFDGDNPVRANYGVRLSASYELASNLVVSGSIRKSLRRNLSVGAISPSPLPPVRREGGRYAVEGDGGIQDLSLAYFGRPGEDLYSRVSVGLLEPAFGGVSTELLYNPVNTSWAVGGELNYVMQRDFDLWGFQDYDVVTGHVSLYYDFDNGFHSRVDVGRYLAGDWGATFTLDREFDNGWRLGGYFTLTDVSAEEFGEGSFDKGIRLSVPLDYIVSTPTRRRYNNTLSSLSRDGGARLRVSGRLYEEVRDGHANDLDDGWGRFWR